MTEKFSGRWKGETGRLVRFKCRDELVPALSGREVQEGFFVHAAAEESSEARPRRVRILKFGVSFRREGEMIRIETSASAPGLSGALA